MRHWLQTFGRRLQFSVRHAWRDIRRDLRRPAGSFSPSGTNHASLRRKVMLMVLSTTCLALMLSATALLIYELRAYRLSRITDLQTQADIIARATAPALSFDDPKTANENLSMLKLRPQITAGAVYRNNHSLFAAYMQPSEASVGLPRDVHSNGYVISTAKLELYHPIRQGDEVLGTLYLRADYDIAGRLIDYLMILLGVMVTSLTAAALITARLQRAVTDPILETAQVARSVMLRRDFSLRAPKTSSDEVGELVDAFNDMLTEVAARTTALEQTNHHLSVEMNERHKAEEALKTAARKKDEFLATLAHELRNPLAPISNATEILRRIGDGDSPMRQRALDIMTRQLRQMVRLIDDLLDVSRITTGKLLLHKERVDLVRVVQSAMEIAAPVLEKRLHVLTVDMPLEPIHVHADATRLAQVFANLLNNAAKYTDEGGQIALSLTAVAQGVEVRIKDNGIGIAPEMQGAIFEMFVQVDPSLDRGRAGLGVGLTLARQLISLHSGRISVHSEGEGLGSEFVVWLPRSGPAVLQGMTTPVAAIADDTRSRRLRVLVADDNIDFATSLGSILESLGHEVTLTHDGSSAVERALQLRPDIVFLDIGMPKLNGYEVAEQLRGQPQTAHSLLVAVTGWGQEQDRLRSRAAGISHHLVKPVELDQVLPILATLNSPDPRA